DPSFSFVPEGRIEVKPFYDVSARLTPRTSMASRLSNRAIHRVEISNGGNAPAAVRIAASDPDERVLFNVSSATLTVAPGERGTVRIEARPKGRVWTGSPVSLPFSVVVASSGPSETR